MVTLFIMLYMTTLGMCMVLLFVDSCVSRRQTIAVFCATLALVLAAVITLYWRAGLHLLMYLYPLVAHLPGFLLLLYLSRYRGWRLLFQLLSTILFCALIQHGAGLVYYLSGRRFLFVAAAYILLTTLVLWFLLRVLRPLFRQVLLELQHGWWLICLVMAGYYAIVIYLIPGYVGLDLSSTVLKPAVSLLMVGFYSVLMILFGSLQKESQARYHSQISALHLSALQSRIEAVKAAEASIRVERHDLRHRLQTLTTLIARGDQETALRFLDAAQRRLDEHKPVRWCQPPVLDAMFSSYFEQARHQGIQVDAHIALPEALPVEEGDFAVVIANILENAIHACLKLPQTQRVIRCKIIAAPSLMLEVSNPCREPVSFDQNGRPISKKTGHGIGTQSICAFCQSCGAVCEFRLSDGWFSVQLIV